MAIVRVGARDTALVDAAAHLFDGPVDKGTELLLYELSVDEAHRRQGIATELVQELGRLASERGCYGMWVLTDDDNPAALATYRRAGAPTESRHIMFTWEPPQS